MIAVKETLVHEEILERKFVCDLNACKGACCVEGEAGAPLNEDETYKLDEIFEAVKEINKNILTNSFEKNNDNKNLDKLRIELGAVAFGAISEIFFDNYFLVTSSTSFNSISRRTAHFRFVFTWLSHSIFKSSSR